MNKSGLNLLFLSVLLLILTSGFVSASCIIPHSGMNIYNDTTFCKGTYRLNDSIYIEGNAVLDCNGATLVGPGENYSGSFKGIPAVLIDVPFNVTVKQCVIENFPFGVGVAAKVSNNNEVQIINNTFTNVQAATKIDPLSASLLIIKDNNVTASQIGIFLATFLRANPYRYYKKMNTYILHNFIILTGERYSGIQSNSRNVSISNNTIICSYNKHYLNDSDSPLGFFIFLGKNVNITYNLVKYCYAGVMFDPKIQNENVKIAYNTFYRCNEKWNKLPENAITKITSEENHFYSSHSLIFILKSKLLFFSSLILLTSIIIYLLRKKRAHKFRKMKL